MKKIIKKRLGIILLFFIIFLAGFIRFYRFYDLAVFLADQASDSLKVLAMTRGKFTLLGPISSVGGFFNGPIVYYLMFPVYLILKGDPISGTVFQTIFSVATIPLLYLLGKNLKNETVGLTASFLFAISPLMIDYSRATFNAHPAIFFSTLILYVFFGITNRFSFLKALSLGVFIGFIFQMHYLTISLLLFVLTYPLFFEKKLISLKYYSSIIFGFLIGLSPFLLFELRHQFLNTNLLIKYLSSHKESSWSMMHIFTIWPETTGKILFSNNYLIGLIIFLIILIIVFKSTNKYIKILLFLFGCVFFIGSIYGGPMQNHYIISFHTSLILLFAFTINYLTNENKWMVFLLLITLLIFNTSSWNLEKQEHPQQDGLSIQDFKNSARIIRNDKKSIYNVAMHAQGDNRAMPLRYILALINESPLDYEHYSEAENLYFIINKKEQPSDLKMWEYTAFGPSKIEKKWFINDNYFVYKLAKIK